MSLGTQFALVLLSSRQDFEETHGALKLTWFTSLDRVQTLKLEGELLEILAPWVGTVRDACKRCGRRRERVCLDLAAVTYADAAGVQLLRDLIRDGVGVAACSDFLAELLLPKE